MAKQSTCILQTASENDIHRIQHIEQMADTIFPQGKLGGTQTTMERSTQLQLIQDETLWLANIGKDAVGFIACKREMPYLYLLQISVLPKYMKQGIGQALFHQSLVYALEQGLTEILLTCFQDIKWNINFYQRLGFTVISDLDSYPKLRQILSEEASAGLINRIAMSMKTN